MRDNAELDRFLLVSLEGGQLVEETIVGITAGPPSKRGLGVEP